ncbi:MAG TPA: GNAT family N-acetyltransferase [Jiangellales bacterium]|nr:GNAT family N-acetyltransferase [Jiangellales bacterium]
MRTDRLTSTVPDLPPGYTARRPSLDDVPALLAVAEADDEVVLGYTDFAESDVRETLTGAHVDPALDHWAVADADGRLVCWGFLADEFGGTQVQLDVYLVRPHPEEVRRAVAAALLGRLAERSAARGLRQVEAGAGSVVGDEQFAATLASLGLTVQRRFNRMRVDLEPGRPFPVPGPGLALRGFDPSSAEDWETFHRVYVAAFTDHWNFEPMSLEAFRRQVENSDDPAYERWTLALVDGRPGGVCQASGHLYSTENAGWVRNLAVLRQHRGRGVGRLLLEHALAGYAADGRAWAGLGVDTDNATGALRLYESVGMRPVFQIDVWTRDLVLDVPAD